MLFLISFYNVTLWSQHFVGSGRFMPWESGELWVKAEELLYRAHSHRQRDVTVSKEVWILISGRKMIAGFAFGSRQQEFSTDSPSIPPTMVR
jgi:hypothetical protein